MLAQKLNVKATATEETTMEVTHLQDTKILRFLHVRFSYAFDISLFPDFHLRS